MSNPTTEQNLSALLNTIEGMASDAEDRGDKDFGLRLSVTDAFQLCHRIHSLETQAARIHELEARVDAVEVVRCRDCKNLIAFADGHHSCGFKPFDGGVSAMDYCSRGERRVNDG